MAYKNGIWSPPAKLDLAVGASPLPGSGLLVEPLWEDVVNRALIPATHDLATRERVRAAELSDLPFFMPPRGFLAWSPRRRWRS